MKVFMRPSIISKSTSVIASNVVFFLRDEEFALFDPNRNDGWLYLDYAKTGVAPFNAFLQNLETTLTPQDSFLPNAQILYREDHTYEAQEILAAQHFVSKLMPEPEMQSRQAIGLIPLGKPRHHYSRGQVLELLTGFNGQVRAELFEDDRRLEPRALKKELAADRRSLRIYHSYGLGIRFSALGLKLKIPGAFFGWYAYLARAWAERWVIMQPFHRWRPRLWDFAFRLSWPFRKVTYFLSYVWANRVRLFEIRVARLKYFVSIVRPIIWKFVFTVSWPLRKLTYMAEYAFRKYRLGKPDKRG